MFVASRDFPTLPFWLPLVEPGTSKRLDLAVPYKSMMATLSPKYNDRDKILLHVRVVQRVDQCGLKLTGEVRYLCTDIGVSYHMGDNAFKWISFQSADTRTHARTRRRTSPLLVSLPRLTHRCSPVIACILRDWCCPVRPSFRCAAARGIRRSIAPSWRII